MKLVRYVMQTPTIKYAPFQQKHSLWPEELLYRQHTARETVKGTLVYFESQGQSCLLDVEGHFLFIPSLTRAPLAYF